MKTYLSQDLEQSWKGRDPFQAAFALAGETFRAVKSRRTLRFELDGKAYFAKLHGGIGWKEFFKDLLQFKKPVTDAGNEYRAIRHLESLGIDTMTVAGCGVRGLNPVRRRSFLITEALTGVISLEDLAGLSGNRAVPEHLRGNLIRQVARMTGLMHQSGLNHRDCYICHFLLKKDTVSMPQPQIFVIDLHRAQIRTHVPCRYRLKDVAGLWFSAMDARLSVREKLRFIRAYEDRPLPQIFADHGRFWRTVDRKARALYRKVHGRDFTPIPPREP